MDPKRTDWHHLAEQASKELDSEKLMSLVDELIRTLESGELTTMRLRTCESVREIPPFEPPEGPTLSVRAFPSTLPPYSATVKRGLLIRETSPLNL